MFRTLCLLILTVFQCVRSQDCVPEPVEGLQLDVNSTLHWRASTNCDDTSYLIYMIYQETVEHFYQVYDTWLDVSFLNACEFYRFVVVAVAYTSLSTEKYLDTTLPAKPDANLTVTQIHVTPQGENAVYLEWALDEKFEKCVQYFRIVHWDGQTVPVDTYTTDDNIVIDNLVPCTRLEFTVTPIYNDELEGGVGVIMYETPAQSAGLAQLESVRPGITYADMTWRLPPYATNRCRISTFIVDGSPYINLTIPITDTPGRPSVPVHVSPLQSDRMYLFYITIVNSGGPSRPVPIAIQTLISAETN
ncbi:hypothetical protein NQ314_021353 [Rhamnusium bicolor]|uniref:Fibronectin type-III domain-containing protein n=1 Tax=Rhamnusium bicolor TaxID=1586634 RepID=A0AAV8WIB0_9CUCU|nr:hypothetical protein NQ314_021353 [Rhamnusium bicolor]